MLAELDLDLIRTFVVFARAENISEAAKRLGLSQPSVSVQLAKFEQALPLSPFTFKGKRKLINAYGHALVEALEPSLIEMEQRLYKVNQSYAQPQDRRLRLAGRREVLERLLPKLNSPGPVEAQPMRGREAIRRLAKLEVDIAVTEQVVDEGDIYAQTLFTEGAQLIAPKCLLSGKALAEAAMDPQFLLSSPVIGYNREMPFFAEWFSHLGLNPDGLALRMMFEDWPTVLKLVAAGKGYSLVPGGFTVDSQQVEYFHLPASIVPHVTFYAYYHRDVKALGVMPTLFQAFKDSVTEAIVAGSAPAGPAVEGGQPTL